MAECKTCKKTLVNRKSFCCRSCQGKYFAKHKIGCCNPKHWGKGGVKGGKATPKMLAAQREMQKLGIGMYAPGFFNPELRKEMGQRAFKVVLERNNFFNGMRFDSRGEMEIAMCLYYQHKIIMKKGKNYQKEVGKSYCDFFINNIFIEYHPGYAGFYDSQKDYYNKRRKNLNKFGYKEYPLVILK